MPLCTYHFLVPGLLARAHGPASAFASASASKVIAGFPVSSSQCRAIRRQFQVTCARGQKSAIEKMTTWSIARIFFVFVFVWFLFWGGPTWKPCILRWSIVGDGKAHISTTNAHVSHVLLCTRFSPHMKFAFLPPGKLRTFQSQALLRTLYESFWGVRGGQVPRDDGMLWLNLSGNFV